MDLARDVIPLLERAYGKPQREGAPRPPIDELIGTILSQNTSDVNTARAFAGLTSRFPDWQAVLEADTTDVVDAIRSGGLANQKGPRIQRVLGRIKELRGDFDLSFLAHVSTEAAVDWLTELPGVGPKTAACVLLFSLDRAVMPVDTHVHRVSLRLGLIPESTSAEQAHTLLGVGMSPAETYRAHMLLIQHGRATCKARSPRCGACILEAICPSAHSVPT